MVGMGYGGYCILVYTTPTVILYFLPFLPLCVCFAYLWENPTVNLDNPLVVRITPRVVLLICR